MNSQFDSHEARTALEIPSPAAPSSLQVLARAAALVVAVLAVLAGVGALAATVPAVAVALGMLAAAAVVVGVVALPVALVHAVGASR
jgi:hypothetical protein